MRRRRRHLRSFASAVAAAGVVAGCGGDSPPTPAEIVECLRDAGGSMEFNPPVRNDTTARDFTPVLTPGTRLVAAGALGETKVDVFLSMGAFANHAEDRGLEFLRLFGLGRDNLLRAGNTLVMLRGARPLADDRDTVRRCVGQRG